MTTQAVKQWIFDRLTESANPDSGTYPRNACAGLLYNAGQIANATTTIFMDRPAHNLQAETSSAIIIDVPGEVENQITTGGLVGSFRNDVAFRVGIVWAADFTGDPGTNTPPAYTSEAVSADYFRRIIQAMRQTLRRLPYRLKSAGVYEAGGWAVTDPHDGFISRIQGSGGKMTLEIDPAMMGENATDIFYGATYTQTLVEVYLGTGL